jgi:hypothetical protein
MSAAVERPSEIDSGRGAGYRVAGDGKNLRRRKYIEKDGKKTDCEKRERQRKS